MGLEWRWDNKYTSVADAAGRRYVVTKLGESPSVSPDRPWSLNTFRPETPEDGGVIGRYATEEEAKAAADDMMMGAA